MRLPSGFRASGDDLETGHGQRPYGARCGGSCTASSNALQSGSGALISSNMTPISAVALVADTATEIATLSFSAMAGDVVLAWANPAASIGTATGFTGEIRLNDVNVPGNVQGSGIESSGRVLPLLMRFVITTSGTNEVSVYVTAVGGTATTTVGEFVYALYRSPPI